MRVRLSTKNPLFAIGTLISVIALFIAAIILLVGCNTITQAKHKVGKSIKVRVYQTKNAGGDNGDFIYWYIITSNNNIAASVNYNSGGYYYYKSPYPVSDFSAADWTASRTLPAEVEKEIELNPTAQVETQEVAVNQLEPELQVEMDQNPEYFEGMTMEEMGDYEGAGTTTTTTTTSNSRANEEEEADNDEGDADASDSGSDSDSGGGDSGGGE